MANEITALATLTLAKGSSVPTLAFPSTLFTQTGDAFSAGKMDVPNSETDVDFGGDFGSVTAGWGLFFNRSSTAAEFIELRQGAVATYVIAATKIPPSGAVLIYLDATADLKAQSDSGTPLMEWLVLEV